MSLGKYDDPAALAEYDDWKTVLKLAPKFVKKWYAMVNYFKKFIN